VQLKFCGGARTVTGSQHLIQVNGTTLLLECGLYQGRRAESNERNRRFLFEPSSVDAVLLSHAHIDHSGNIPTLIKAGFGGPVYATAATVDLCQIMLRDSAYLQERDAHFVNKIGRHKNAPEVTPLYSIKDAEDAMASFVGVQFNRPVPVAPGISATFREAGHILGSAGIVLDLIENGRQVRLGFTGDVGRSEVPILRDPDELRDLDVLIMESTYGNRLHGAREDVEEEMAGTIRDVAARGGRVIIPAFAVGRTQVIVYLLHRLFDQKRIPDIPIYVDSPLARSATEVFRTHPECYDRETYSHFLDDQQDPFGFSRLSYLASVEESKGLNSLAFPHVIISASGMAVTCPPGLCPVL
jgi:metallo-beta-lactamase family protein